MLLYKFSTQIFKTTSPRYLNYNSNLQVSHVICILETLIQSSNDVHNFINTSKYSYISIYDGHGLIMMYNAQCFYILITQHVMDYNIYQLHLS
jgi:hypothetical protein